jgi:hypothetical protein
MSIFSICADPYSSGTPRSHGRDNSSMMETTMKVVGAAGAFFFTLGAMLLDPLLLVPAAICAVLAIASLGDCDLFSIFSSAYVPSASSGWPRHHYTHTRVPAPGYIDPYSVGTTYSTQTIRANPVSLTAHTARGGGTVLTQQPYATGLNSGTWGNVVPAAESSYQPVLTHQHYTAPPPVVHTGRGGTNIAMPPPANHYTQPPAPPSYSTVASAPRVNVQRGGGSDGYVLGGRPL